MKRLVSGIKPTGELHIGHYIGAIKHFIAMQKEYEAFVFIADLHSLTINPDPKTLKQNIKELVGLYLACGLDPKHTTIFNQSENTYHSALGWVLECNSYMGEMKRMTQYKEKSQNGQSETVTCGLFTYPILMAADILLYDADVVPVGIDQKQHVELTRNIAERFNNRYGKTFKIPQPVIAEAGAKIMDLQNPNKKMSKTEANTKGVIFLLDDLGLARKKIMSAVTDSEAVVKFDPELKPGVSNLMTLYSCLINKSLTEIEKEFEKSNYGEFKTKVADAVVDFLKPIQERYYALVMSNEIDKVLEVGLEKTKKIADAKLKEVYHKLGVGRY